MIGMAAPIELVIFDCDGVVVDSEPISAGVLRTMLAELGLDLTPEDVDAHFTGHTLARVLERAAALLGRPLPDSFAPDFDARTFAEFAARLAPVEGVVDVLDRLVVPCCIASNGSHAKMRLTLGTTALASRFEGRRFSAEDVARGKPWPDLLLHAAARMGVAAGHCLVVEDSATGVRAARAAGMRVYGFAPGASAPVLLEAGAERTFSRMPELAGLLGDLMSFGHRGRGG